MQPEYRQLQVSQLVLSQTTVQKERRAHYDRAALKDLAANVKAVGVIEPIIVRPNGKADTFEICAGERRTLAAKQAGLIEIPAMIHQLTDGQLLELQLVENLQREGLHELAEAEGYEQLIKLGMDVDQIIAKVGKSRSYIYSRMKLTACCKEVRVAFYDGTIVASTALELARIPVDSLQRQALKEITTSRGNDEPMSVRSARDHIRDNFMLRLSTAGFPTEDKTLLPAAGACGSCPKRTGNQPELFGDVKSADVCTDLTCFKAKIKAFGKVSIEKARETGQKVIAGDAVKKVAPHGIRDHMYMPEHVRLDERSYQHDNKTYGQIMGKDYVPTLLQDPDSGKMIKIVPRADLPKPKRTGSKSSGSSAGPKIDHQKEKAKRDLEAQFRRRLLALIFDKAPSTLNRRLLIMICSDAAWDVGPTGLKQLIEDCNVGVKAPATYSHIDGERDKVFAKLTPDVLTRLAFVLKLHAGMPDDGHGSAKELETAAAELKIDVKKVRAEISAATKSAAKSAMPAAPKKKAKAPARKK